MLRATVTLNESTVRESRKYVFVVYVSVYSTTTIHLTGEFSISKEEEDIIKESIIR